MLLWPAGYSHAGAGVAGPQTDMFPLSEPELEEVCADAENVINSWRTFSSSTLRWSELRAIRAAVLLPGPLVASIDCRHAV